MRIFLDANILVSVLNKEYPLFTWSARVLSLAGKKRFTLYTSAVCLAIAFYFAEKKSGTRAARTKIGLLTQHVSIAGLGGAEVIQAVKDQSVNDFEDGLQYYAAKAAKCRCIITEDVHDFYFSELEVLTAEQFLRKYLS